MTDAYTVVEVEERPTTVTVVDPAAPVELGPEQVVAVAEQSVEVVTVGVPGPAGLDGSDDAHYVHVQSPASDEWTVPHGLGKHPAVTIVDTMGREVDGEVEHVDVNNLVLRFTVPFPGTAYLN